MKHHAFQLLFIVDLQNSYLPYYLKLFLAIFEFILVIDNPILLHKQTMNADPLLVPISALCSHDDGVKKVFNQIIYYKTLSCDVLVISHPSC